MNTQTFSDFLVATDDSGVMKVRRLYPQLFVSYVIATEAQNVGSDLRVSDLVKLGDAISEPLLQHNVDHVRDFHGILEYATHEQGVREILTGTHADAGESIAEHIESYLAFGKLEDDGDFEDSEVLGYIEEFMDSGKVEYSSKYFQLKGDVFPKANLKIPTLDEIKCRRVKSDALSEQQNRLDLQSRHCARLAKEHVIVALAHKLFIDSANPNQLVGRLLSGNPDHGYMQTLHFTETSYIKHLIMLAGLYVLSQTGSNPTLDKFYDAMERVDYCMSKVVWRKRTIGYVPTVIEKAIEIFRTL